MHRKQKEMKMVEKKKETFKCQACGKRVSMDECHVIKVNQKNRPVKNSDVMFSSVGEVQVCGECFKRYGPRK